MGLSPIRVVRSERAADEFFQCYLMPPCPTNPRSRRLPRLRFAQVVSKAQVIASQLLVGFSDDRRFFVQILVLLVFFVLVIIIVGMSRRHRVTAHDGDETPNVLGDTWSHFRLLCGCRVSWRC